MELRFFSDLIDALGKTAVSLKALVNLPRAERETIRQTLDETYHLVDTTLNMVIIRSLPNEIRFDPGPRVPLRSASVRSVE